MVPGKERNNRSCRMAWQQHWSYQGGWEQCNQFAQDTCCFFSPISRAVWFASRFALRVSELPLNFAATLLMISERLEPKQLAYFCNILWVLWKARNEEFFSAKKASAHEILTRATTLEFEETKAPNSSKNTVHKQVVIPRQGRTILKDGSWDAVHGTGTGMVVYNRRGDLIYVQYGRGIALDPF